MEHRIFFGGTALFAMLVAALPLAAQAPAPVQAPAASAPAPAAEPTPAPSGSVAPASTEPAPAAASPATTEALAAPPPVEYAEPSPAEPMEPPAAAEPQPAPAPPMPRDPTAHHHDGFFARMSLGLGYGSLKVTERLTGENEQKAKFSGPALMVDVMMAGTLAPGFVLGGAVMIHSMSEPTFEYNDDEVEAEDVVVGVSGLGIFAAFYPDPTNGLNLHALLGYGGRTIEIDGEDYSDDQPSGPMLAAGVGYDFWISEQWSLGPSLRVTYAHMSMEETQDGMTNNWTDSFISPTLAFTATYH